MKYRVCKEFVIGKDHSKIPVGDYVSVTSTRVKAFVLVTRKGIWAVSQAFIDTHLALFTVNGRRHAQHRNVNGVDRTRTRKET